MDPITCGSTCHSVEYFEAILLSRTFTIYVHCTLVHIMFLFSVALLQTSQAFTAGFNAQNQVSLFLNPVISAGFKGFLNHPGCSQERVQNQCSHAWTLQAVYQITFAWMHRNWFSSRMCFPCLMLNHWPETKSFKSWKMFHMSAIVVKCLVFILYSTQSIWNSNIHLIDNKHSKMRIGMGYKSDPYTYFSLL